MSDWSLTPGEYLEMYGANRCDDEAAFRERYRKALPRPSEDDLELREDQEGDE